MSTRYVGPSPPQGVQFAFGIVGFPIIEVGFALQQAGVHYVAMRNEQSAAYAAQVMGYLSGRPAVCLAVSGPGVLHALGGLANAAANNWPMILIGGSSDVDQESRGAFQEWPQVAACAPYCKYSARFTSLNSIPLLVEKAVRMSTYGRQGPCYLDIPGNLVVASIENDISQLPTVPLPPPVSSPRVQDVQNAAEILKCAKHPLIIIGKGAVNAADALRSFITATKLPFLPSPMGKGVVPDDCEFNVAAARSFALSSADVVLLCGARLNWMLHFGMPPRFHSQVKILLIDSHAEEFHQNVPSAATMCGDIRLAVDMLSLLCKDFQFDTKCDWWKNLEKNVDKNKLQIQAMATDPAVPLNYYAAYKPITDRLPRDAIIVNEGANTMDIGRSMLPNFTPKSRLDAATFGTMGIGLGSAVAAAFHERHTARAAPRPVIAVLGDSAFGFSGMELETVARCVYC